MLKSLMIAALAVLCFVFPPSPAAACSNDLTSEVKTEDACFAIDTLSKGDGNALVVFLHGDSGVAWAGKYGFNYLAAFEPLSQTGARVVVMARPGGYRLPDGRRTTGIRARTWDNYTPEVVADIAEALAILKSGLGAKKLVLLGHSGGAMISGIIAGRHPGVADAAVLVAFACNTPEWRDWQILSAGRNSRFPDSLSAHDFIDGIPTTFRVRAVTGSEDANTKSEFAEDCVNAMKVRGIDATLDVVEGRGHNDVMRAPDVLKAVLALL